MCFTIHKDHQEIKMATEDIVCYKLFKLATKNSSEKYVTPFTQLKVNEKSLMESKLGKSALDFPDELSFGIHSLTTLNATTQFKRRYFTKHSDTIVIVECTIPKGSEYYYNPDENQYISNQLQLGEEIKNIRTQKILNFIANLFNNLK